MTDSSANAEKTKTIYYPNAIAANKIYIDRQQIDPKQQVEVMYLMNGGKTIRTLDEEDRYTADRIAVDAKGREEVRALSKNSKTKGVTKTYDNSNKIVEKKYFTVIKDENNHPVKIRHYRDASRKPETLEAETLLSPVTNDVVKETNFFSSGKKKSEIYVWNKTACLAIDYYDLDKSPQRSIRTVSFGFNHGECIEKYPSGNISAVRNYCYGTKHGPQLFYPDKSDAMPHLVLHYKDGCKRQDGKIEFNENAETMGPVMALASVPVRRLAL